jgi:cobalamin biosynthesis protein CobD/CbiB
MCHKIGLGPTSTIGFGRTAVSSLNLVPYPPAKITTFITHPSQASAAPAARSHLFKIHFCAAQLDSPNRQRPIIHAASASSARQNS